MKTPIQNPIQKGIGIGFILAITIQFIQFSEATHKEKNFAGIVAGLSISAIAFNKVSE
jgi:hypothetical protein